MRVGDLLLGALCLSVCMCGVFGLNADGDTFTITGANSINSWLFSGGQANGNDPLTVVAGQTYKFKITFDNGAAFHPFTFSGDGDTAASQPSITAYDAGFVVSGSGCAVGDNTSGPFSGPTCVVSLNVTSATLVGKPLYYRCTNHRFMVGQITVVAASSSSSSSSSGGISSVSSSSSTGTSTLSSSSSSTGASTFSSSSSSSSSPSGSTNTTTAPPTSPPPVVIAGGTITGSNFRITGNNGPLAFIFTDVDGRNYSNPTLNVTAGRNVTISLEFSTFHPLGFSNNSSPNVLPSLTYDYPDNYNQYTFNNAQYCNTSFAPKTVRMATANIATPLPCVITINVPTIDAAVPELFYRCARHPAMIGRINVIAGPTSTPTATPTNQPGVGTPVAGIGAGMALISALIMVNLINMIAA